MKKTMEEREQAAKEVSSLEEVLAKIRKRFGDESIMTLGAKEHLAIEALETGVPELDTATGVGGLPKGRIAEIFGRESVGKSTLAMLMIAKAQEKGLKCALIDVEHALDPTYAKKLGVKLEELLFSQPNSGEEALEICHGLIQTGEVALIVMDTVAALTPMREWEDEIGTPQVALLARLMGQALRKLSLSVSKSKSVLIFLNQIREKPVAWGKPETTPGGLALKFFASIRIELKRGKNIMKDGKISGFFVEATVVKNKVARPFEKAQLTIKF